LPYDGQTPFFSPALVELEKLQLFLNESNAPLWLSQIHTPSPPKKIFNNHHPPPRSAFKDLPLLLILFGLIPFAPIVRRIPRRASSRQFVLYTLLSTFHTHFFTPSNCPHPRFHAHPSSLSVPFCSWCHSLHSAETSLLRNSDLNFFQTVDPWSVPFSVCPLPLIAPFPVPDRILNSPRCRSPTSFY